MKKKITLSFSLSLLLIVLFFWGRQEVEKNHRLLIKLAQVEVENFITVMGNVEQIVTDEATPLIVVLRSEKINEMLVSKCKLGQISLTYKNGQEISWDKSGDAGIIRECISEGQDYKDPTHQEEIDYYKRTLRPSWFSFWDYLKYFSNKLFILLLIFLPIFLSFQLLLFAIVLIILIISLMKLSACVKEKKQGKAQIEYSIKKPPPKISVQIFNDNHQFFVNEFTNPDIDKEKSLVPIIISFFAEFNDKTRKVVNKIFHIPEFKFVID